MKKSTVWQRVGEFVVGKGFYIVLFLCVATIGISGYYLVSVFSSGEDPEQTVTGQAQVVLPDQSEQIKAEEPDITQPEVPPAQADSAPQRQSQEEASSAQITQQEAAVSAVPQAVVFTWPVKGEVISDFSLEVLAYDETMGDWRTHSGVDIAAQEGTRVLAMSAGTVEQVYEDDLMGVSVVIQHADGLVSCYHNLADKPTVSVGDQVETGTVIGTVGATAIAESGRPGHLHLEVTRNGVSVDPVEYLPQY